MVVAVVALGSNCRGVVDGEKLSKPRVSHSLINSGIAVKARRSQLRPLMTLGGQCARMYTLEHQERQLQVVFTQQAKGRHHKSGVVSRIYLDVAFWPERHLFQGPRLASLASESCRLKSSTVRCYIPVDTTHISNIHPEHLHEICKLDLILSFLGV